MRKGILLLPLLIIACAPVSEKEVKNMEKRISELEARVAKLEERQEEIGEKLEIINERVDKIAREIGEIKKEMYLRPKEEIKREEERKEKEEERGELPEVAGNPKEDYKEALNLYKLKRLNEARDLFVDFIKKYPKTDLTDNAYFWLGMIYYELGNTDRALQIFETLVEKCKGGGLPDCNKLPDTYYMLVKVYTEQGDVNKAEEYFTTLKMEFPNSPLVEKAESILYKPEE